MNCFELHGRKDLQDQFDSLVSSGKNEMEAAREVVLGAHKQIHDDMNSLRTESKFPTIDYKEPQDITSKLSKIEKKYSPKTKEVSDAEKIREAIIGNLDDNLEGTLRHMESIGLIKIRC